MSVISKEYAEKLVKSGEYRWLTDEETERLACLGLDIDGDVDPYSGAWVFTETVDTTAHDYKRYRGIISCDSDITRVSLSTFARHPEIYDALSEEQKEAIWTGAKRGRPPKNPLNKRNYQYRFRLTKNEREILEEESAFTGLTISTIIRKALSLYFKRRVQDNEKVT